MVKGKNAEYKTEVNRELLYKTLTDPGFRRILRDDPKKALGLETFTEVNEKEVQRIFETVKDIEVRVGRLADSLLCADGPCGIA